MTISPPGVAAVVAAICLGLGCGQRSPPFDRGFGPSALIVGVPHVLQKPDFCGEADVEMYLRHLGKPISQDQVFAISGMDPARGKGVTTSELATALERLGFAPGPVWYQVDPAKAEREVGQIWQGLVRDLEAKIPSIVCMNTGGPSSSEHFRLVLGYDADRDEVIYHEPAEERGAYRRMARARLFKQWPLKYAEQQWTVVRLRLEARKLVDPPPLPRGFSPSDMVQHVMALRRHLPAGFTVVVEPPFVVVGNGEPAEVRRYAKDTVGWAVRRLRQDFFPSDPKRILDIWLLADEESYVKASLDLTGEEPDTPYGYYASKQGVLVMNIATGGGTLVHEIVHPFMEANCPRCPAWFNEGLGSLYEQCSERRGHIVGLRNWRLLELQAAIKEHSVPTFRELTRLTGRAFYQGRHSLHYAQARYLLFALQEADLLLPFYRSMTGHLQSDPSGYAALTRVVGEDMAEFERRWEAAMLKL